MSRRFHVRLFARDAEYDATERTAEIGKITQDLEEDLLALTHSDMTVRFFDDDGRIRSLFEDCRRGDVFELVVERETGKRRPMWERLFAGVADIPGSVRIDSANQEVSVQFFSFGKQLELYDAGTLKRNIGSRTGSVSQNSKNVTVSSSTGLVVGDKISLTNSAGVQEEQTIETIPSGTQVTTVAEWQTSFSNAQLVLETPFYRAKTVQWLAEQLFQIAQFPPPSVDISSDLASRPFPSNMSAAGLPAGCPDSLLEFEGKIRAFIGGKHYDAENVDSGFGPGVTDSPKLDWQPYVLTEPTALQPTGPEKYDYQTGDKYSLRTKEAAGTTELWLVKNGTDLVRVAVVVNDGYSYGEFTFDSLEVAPTHSRVWVGYQTHTWSYQPAFERYHARTKVFSTSGTEESSFWGGAGPMKFCARTSVVVLEVLFSGNGSGTKILRLFSEYGPSKNLQGSQNTNPETIRAFLDLYAGVSVDASGSHVLLWSQSTGEIVSDFLISKSMGSACATVFKDGGADSAAEYCGQAGGRWFTISTRVSGVVPYADFEGKSVAAAVRDLAIFSGCYFAIDPWRQAILWARDSAQLSARPPRELTGAPLERTELPVWENLRTKITVSGKDEAGDDVVVPIGASGDSAEELQIDIPFPFFKGYAEAIGNAYINHLGKIRSQFEETILEPDDGPLQALDRVVRDGRDLITLRVETNPMDREQTLVFVDQEARP